MRITVHIENLKCCGCVNTIIHRLSKVKNIDEVDVNNEQSTVTFNYRTSHDFENAKHLLSRIGYPIIGTENNLKTKLQSYVSCAIGKIKK